MRVSRLGAGLAVAVLAVVLAACGDNKDPVSLPSLSTAPTPTAPSSAPTTTNSPSPQPTAEPTHSTQKYGSLTLLLNHPVRPTVGSRLVLQAYDGFERSAHKSLATNVEDPNLAKWSAAAALKTVRDVLRDQQAKAVRTGGTVKVTANVSRTPSTIAILTGCYDQSKSLLVRANGSSYTGPLTKKTPQLQLTVILTNMSGRWLVTEYKLKGGKC